MKKAELYIHGEVVTGRLLRTDDQTYIIKLHVFELETGKHAGEKVAIFENGDKFKEWI